MLQSQKEFMTRLFHYFFNIWNGSSQRVFTFHKCPFGYIFYNTFFYLDIFATFKVGAYNQANNKFVVS